MDASMHRPGSGRVIVLRNRYNDGIVTVRNSYVKILVARISSKIAGILYIVTRFELKMFEVYFQRMLHSKIFIAYNNGLYFVTLLSKYK